VTSFEEMTYIYKLTAILIKTFFPSSQNKQTSQINTFFKENTSFHFIIIIIITTTTTTT